MATTLAACSAIPSESSTEQPLNTCPAHSCGAYNQSLTANCVACSAISAPAGCTSLCEVSDTSQQLTLVVELPESSTFAAGTTFVLPFTTLPQLLAHPTTCKTLNCVQLPALSKEEGSLTVDYPNAMTAGFYLGSTGNTTLPAAVAVRPLTTDPSGVIEDVALAGFSVQAPTVMQTTPSYGLSPVGPYGTHAVGFSMNVAPGDYGVTLTPAPPFDQYYPPLFDPAGMSSLDFNNSGTVLYPLVIDPPASSATTIYSAQALDGFVAYLRDQTTHVRVSSQVPLSGLSTPVQLHTSDQDDPMTPGALRAKLEIVIAPSDALAASTPAVTFADGVVGGALPAPKFGEVYPPLPAAVDVEGQVLDASGSPVVAEIALASTGIARIDKTELDTTTLSYATTFATDSSGSYKVMLPPGDYTAIVTPNTSTSAAITTTTLDVASDVSVQRGKTLSVQATVHLKGNSAIADGRALAGATIQVKPAASLSVTPGTLPPPRPFVGTTNADGSFDLLVDPGVYDLTVKPPDGSNLPWLVTSSLTVPPSTGLTTALQIVPAPAAVAYTFFTNIQALPNALVHAYAQPNPSAVAVEVANGITDASGQVQLLLAGTPQ